MHKIHGVNVSLYLCMLYLDEILHVLLSRFTSALSQTKKNCSALYVTILFLMLVAEQVRGLHPAG